MKRIIFILFLAILTASAFQTSGPDIGFDSDKFDFGKIKVGTVITHTFIVQNNGDQPLIISKVVPSCGCAVAAYTKEPIKGGGRGEIVAKFHSKNRPLGFSLKSLTVFSNSKNSPHTIYLKGDLTK